MNVVLTGPAVYHNQHLTRPVITETLRRKGHVVWSKVRPGVTDFLLTDQPYHQTRKAHVAKIHHVTVMSYTWFIDKYCNGEIEFPEEMLS